MPIEQIVTIVTAAFMLPIAMSGPIGPDTRQQDRSEIQATALAESAEIVAEDGESRDDAPDTEAPRFCALDGCEFEHQGCVCSNTGWNGYCGWGPHHPGCLYCRCD